MIIALQNDSDEYLQNETKGGDQSRMVHGRDLAIGTVDEYCNIAF